MAPASPTTRRRSGIPSISKSPDSDRPKDPFPRPKRLKQEDIDPVVDVHPPSIASSTSSTSNIRAKRKTKEKDKDKDKLAEKEIPRTDEPAPDAAPDAQQPPAEEEENGVTRCICGREDDPDAGEFMVQCETCKVWQHGLCMGYDSEAQLHDDDYYCEQCRPDFHTEYLKKARRKARHSSTTSHHTAAPPRQSRSHSPSLLKQPSKRRNTMNSRDAAFDENLKEILETTAAEAGATHEPGSSPILNGNGHPELDEDGEPGPTLNRKKRKRIEEDAPVKKRTRSASSASDRRLPSAIPRDESPPPAPKPGPPPKAAGRRRGGRKAAVHELVVSIEGEEVSLPAPVKRGHGGRAKGGNAAKRTAVSAAPISMSHEHATRRNNTAAPNGHASTSAAVESTRAYRNSHAYAVSQQPMFTSWNLPDYLAHLEEILPSETPQPLEVLSGAPQASSSRAGSLERTMERGVKVKWPSKRMSVGDMNKRVRALVEWVGREQASASERGKRKEALEEMLREEQAKDSAPLDGVDGAPQDDSMAVDPPRLDKAAQKYDTSQASTAMKMMEELMEELIRFQERFGPGAKRERRAAAS
ncbi:hypothetical protein DFH07DRAFT_806067 [Mycena maculata]|uniref:PHD-type domain-containing protein n=1 Tax=Mycena maculata TaxID=230809 RepID=A0AAD7NPM3_9AGAR|nr:hypothetical protein DFH07DRAFT_806067 [Mycena maculata]